VGTLARAAVVGASVIFACGSIAASPGEAQTRSISLHALPKELAPGDVVTVRPAGRATIKGRLIRVDAEDLELRIISPRASRERRRRDEVIALDSIRSLERPHDSTRNGLVIGATIGGGFGAAMFVHALAVDRNEIDEWAAPYLGVATLCTGIGALIGWAADAARSKPRITYAASIAPTRRTILHPAVGPGRRFGLAVTLLR
jgi:hypothetical protein